MKRHPIIVVAFCILFLASCMQVQRPKPWNVSDQHPDNTGFLFIKVKPTVKYSPGGSITCMSMWSLSGEKSKQSGQREGGLIETPYLLDGRYFIYPLKPGPYMIGYAIGIIGLLENRSSIRYTLAFEIKPGEVAYLGSFNPIDEFKYSKSFNQHKVDYNFIKMEIIDEFDNDVNWLKNRFPSIFDKFQLKNYTPEIRYIKKNPA